MVGYRSVRVARQVWAPGKAVRIRRDPVTVIGDETHGQPLVRVRPDREGVGSRTIRKPGDLPGRLDRLTPVFEGGPGETRASLLSHT